MSWKVWPTAPGQGIGRGTGRAQGLVRAVASATVAAIDCVSEIADGSEATTDTVVMGVLHRREMAAVRGNGVPADRGLRTKRAPDDTAVGRGVAAGGARGIVTGSERGAQASVGGPERGTGTEGGIGSERGAGSERGTGTERKTGSESVRESGTRVAGEIETGNDIRRTGREATDGLYGASKSGASR
jgi:hypothetical protein